MSWGDNTFSTAFADQTAFDAEHSSPTWVWMAGTTRPDITPAQEVQTLETTVSADFEADTLIPGTTQGGTLSFSAQLRSQLSSYDPASGDPVENPEVKLLREIMGGSATGTYDAGDAVLSGSDANTVVTTSGTYAPGQFYGWAAASTGALRGAGWIKSQASQTLTLFEDARAVVGDGDDMIQFLNLYPGGTAPTPKTFRTTGDDSTRDLRVIGAMPTGCTINGNAGSGITLDFSYEFASPLQFDTSAGGLNAGTKYLAVPPLMGMHNARLWIGGDENQDGSVETTGTCGVGDFSVALAIDYGRNRCHAGQWGVSNLYPRRRRATASFHIPFASTWVEADGTSTWHKSLNDGTTFSLTLLVGTTIGQIFAMRIPAARVVAVADWTSAEGLLGWNVTVEPTTYTGDGSSSGAGNSPITFAIG